MKAVNWETCQSIILTARASPSGPSLPSVLQRPLIIIQTGEYHQLQGVHDLQGQGVLGEAELSLIIELIMTELS